MVIDSNVNPIEKINDNIITIDDDDESMEPFNDDSVLENVEKTFDNEIFHQNCDLINLPDKDIPSMVNIVVNGSIKNLNNGRNGFLQFYYF